MTDPFAGYPVCQRRAQSGHRVVYDAYTLPSLQLPLTNPEVESELRFMPRLRRIERHCLLTADLVFAGSMAFKAHLEGLGVPAERIRLVPPRVDLGHYLEAPFPPEAPLQLAYVGGCAAWEGIETPLKAVRLLLDAGVPTKLSIAGELNEAAKRLLRSTSAALRLGEAVELLGPFVHERLNEVLENAHVCLAPFSAPAAVGPVGLGSIKLVVEAMWAMLQQPEPDNFVIATGTTTSVRDMCRIAFSHIGLNSEDYVVVDQRLYRPAEVEVLIGNPAKAKARLGWEHKTPLETLIRNMVDADLARVRHEMDFYKGAGSLRA